MNDTKRLNDEFMAVLRQARRNDARGYDGGVFTPQTGHESYICIVLENWGFLERATSVGTWKITRRGIDAYYAEITARGETWIDFLRGNPLRGE